MELGTSQKRYITPIEFYGNKISNGRQKLHEVNRSDNPVPFELKRILGPTSVWKVFKKQIEALTFAKTKKCEVMSFVFQQSNGERLFLVAHPQWLWHYDSRKDQSCRCSYEIIPEYTVCKLYFDLEYEITFNPNNDGVTMTNTFIEVVCFYINLYWKLKIDRTSVLDLDSSTNSKFSRHLIFNLDKLVFRDNYNVGRFVKYICNEIRKCIEQLESGKCEHILMVETSIPGSSIKMLQVTNSKSKSVLFCDGGVYTKNRHFRLFKSTKLKRNAPLVLSDQNLYSPSAKSLNIEEQVFLDSLITYLPDANDNLKVIQFNDNEETNTTSKTYCNSSNVENCKSPFPKIDGFIEKIVYPGHIWRNNYFQTSNKIVYDIIGNRYCGNIGREHRSNNVKQIVDINSRCYYQKCHDPECFSYRSEMHQLPPEIQFYLDDEFDSYMSENNIELESSFNDMNDDELFEIADVIEQVSCEFICE